MTLPTDYANETVSIDNHPGAHNETNAAVNLLDAAVTTLDGTVTDLDGRVETLESAVGVPGPPGPAGPPGGGTQQSVWTWQAPAQTPPFAQAGRVGVNNNAPAAATMLYLHRIAQLAGIDWSATISTLVAGDDIYLQTKTDASSWHRYTITGLPTVASNTWSIPVVTDTGSPAGTEPGNGVEVVVAFQRPGGAGARRADISVTTGSLADDATEDDDFDLAAATVLATRIATDVAARVRIYTTAAARTADASRAIGTDPTGDHGLLLEFVTTVGELDWTLSPAVWLSSPDTSYLFPAAVTNLSGATDTVTVTLTVLPLESAA